MDLNQLDNTGKMRIVQELVPGKQITIAHVIANPDQILYRKLGLDPADVCKTLVTVGKNGGHYVFVLPVNQELDRKKAASLVGEKSLEMLHVKDLLSTTGYIRGGCTALGMKKRFPTVVDQSVREKEAIYVSGGKRGLQLKLAPADLVKAASAMWGDVIVKD